MSAKVVLFDPFVIGGKPSNDSFPANNSLVLSIICWVIFAGVTDLFAKGLSETSVLAIKLPLL